MLTNNDLVFIRSEQENLEVGKILAVTTEHSRLTSPSLNRRCRAYPILGKVRIIEKRNDTWVGRIEGATAPIERRRGVLIESPDRVLLTGPVAAIDPVEARLLLAPQGHTKLSAQHEIAFIDRGKDDGITEGMVLRGFQSHDPYDDSEISSKRIAISSDVQVLQAYEKFSSVLVVRSTGTPLEQGALLVALTDVSDLKRMGAPRSIDIESGEVERAAPIEEPAPPPVEEKKDDLDSLESSDELSDEEKKNLEQLEKHPSEPESATPSPEETEKLPELEQQKNQLDRPQDSTSTPSNEAPLPSTAPPTDKPPEEDLELPSDF